MKYVTKPVVTVVEAIQWTGNNLQEVIDFVGKHHVGPIERRPDYPLTIRDHHTTNWWEVSRQHWIVKGAADDPFVICSPALFEQTYQTAAEAEKAIGQYHGPTKYDGPINSLLPPDWPEQIEAAKQAMRDLGSQIIVTQRAFEKAGLTWPELKALETSAP